MTDKNHLDETVLTIVQGKGTLPREQAGRNIHYDDASLSNYKMVQKGDFIIHLRSFEGGLEMANENGIVSPAYTILRGKKPHSSRFYEAYFHTDEFVNHVLSKSVEGIRDGRQISYDAFKWLGLPYCSPSEQAKIAELFSVLTKRIEKQTVLVDSLKKYKRGVMQHIFHRATTQSVKAWTCVKLGDIFKKVSRRNTDGSVKNVITNSAEYGLIPQRDFFDKDIAVNGNTANYYVIEKGDFVYNPRKSNTAPYGPFNRYTLNEKGIISPLYTCLVLKAEIYPSYLAWYFRSDAWHRYIYDNGSQGVRHDRVSMTDDLLMGIPVVIPDQAKQHEYADVLDKIEARLQASQKEYDLLVKVKCGYMQQLFI
ncbi:MAG: restriction endonuclease subunit S [Lachnospirales bacterium]